MRQSYPARGTCPRSATCALRCIPYALLRQVRPGRVVVAPLAREFWSGALVQLRIQGDGTAVGPFCGGSPACGSSTGAPATVFQCG